MKDLFDRMGCVVATAMVSAARWLDAADSEAALIDCAYTRRFGLLLSDIVRLEKPVYCRGHQGIFHIKDELIAGKPEEWPSVTDSVREGLAGIAKVKDISETQAEFDALQKADKEAT